MTAQLLNDQGALHNEITNELRADTPLLAHGRGDWDSSNISIGNYKMLEITLVTFGSGQWFMKSSGGWGFDGVYGDQANACHNFAHNIGANNFGQFYLNRYDQIKLHMLHRGSTNWAFYMHNSGYGNYLGDSWGQLFGSTIAFRHSRDHWYGAQVRGYY